MSTQQPQPQQQRLAWVAFSAMMVYALLAASISLGTLLYFNVVPGVVAPVVGGEVFMLPLSLEFCVAALHAGMHIAGAALLYTGFMVGMRRHAAAVARAVLQSRKAAEKNGAAAAACCPGAPLLPVRPLMPTRVAVGSALLFAASLTYLLSYGATSLGSYIESSVMVGDGTGAAAAAVTAMAEGGAVEAAAVDVAALGAGAADVGQCRRPARPSGQLRAVDFLYIAVESLADLAGDVIDRIIGDDDRDSGEWYRPAGDGGAAAASGAWQDSSSRGAPPDVWTRLRRTDLIALHVMGLAATVLGMALFDISVDDSVARRSGDRPPAAAANPQLTEAAVAALSGTAAKPPAPAGAVAGAAEPKKTRNAAAERRKKADAFLAEQETLADPDTHAADGPSKKNQ